MLGVEQRNDIVPICPHCETALGSIQCQELQGLLGKRYVYFCPECKKVLGVSHRKGFWMG